jgi:hypothetical protein
MSETFNSSCFAAYSWLILAFPLLSFLVNGVFLGTRKSEGYKRVAGLFSISMALLSMVFALGLACEFIKCFANVPVAERVAMP